MKLIPADGVILVAPDGLEEEIEISLDDADVCADTGVLGWRILGPDGKPIGGSQ